MAPLDAFRLAYLEKVIGRRTFLAALAAAPAAFGGQAPRPFGAIPSTRQLLWHELETTAFLHFGLNTFTGKEWGYGDEDPSLFAPSDFDADAIIEPLAEAGMRGVILTAKHHDGFCLWPTRATPHSIRNSRWRGGKGDVVREFAEAARRRKLAFGVYLSPWDRNAAEYGKPAYLDKYRQQLKELLSDYGPLFEVWHDGANGGDGYYGGAREKRLIDKRAYYGWPATWELVRKLQPGAVIFSDVGPDVRWVGNERGIAGDPCWATYDPVGADGGPASPGDVRERESPTGHRNGSRWLPPECDVSIRKGWFWRETEDATVKTCEQIADLYFRSVGRGANLLLNIPPDRRGRLGAPDVASFKAFGAWRKAQFGRDLARGAKVTATNSRGGAFKPGNLVDGRVGACWATDDAVMDASAVVELRRPETIGVIRIREAIQYGQRIDGVSVERWDSGAWQPVADATSIGARRLIKLEKPVTAGKLRLRITKASASPAISEFALYALPV
jgi:alpha-L-fucosidase